MLNLTRKCGSCTSHDILEPRKRSDNNNNSTLTSRNGKNSSPFEFSSLNGIIGEMKRSHNDDDSLSSSCSRNSGPPRSSPSHPAPASKIAHKASSDSHSKLSSSNKCSKSAESKTTNRNCSSVNCEVFLGGSCNPTTWRTEIAIPMLKTLGITYFNPQVASWCPELMEAEHNAKENANILFFVIDNQTRAVAAMLEVAYLVAQGKNVVLVITGLKGPGQIIMDEPISQSEYEDLTCGQLVLQDLVERHQIPVFADILSAIRCASKIIHENLKLRDLIKLRDLGPLHLTCDSASKLKFMVCNKLKRIFESLATPTEEITFSDVRTAYKSLMNQELFKEEIVSVLDEIKLRERTDPEPIVDNFPEFVTKNPKNSSDNMLNFEQFCCVMIELIYHRRNALTQSSSSSLTLATTSCYVHNISLVLNKLLENLPYSKTTLKNSAALPLRSEIVDSTSASQKRDVYLGGLEDPLETWRTSLAIPLLEKHGLTSWSPESAGCDSRSFFLPFNSTEIADCRVLFFHLSSSSRALETLILAAYYIGLKRNVVLCIANLDEDCQIRGEPLTKLAVKDYNRARSYVSDIARREGISVFENLNEALECVVTKCKAV